MAKQPQKPLKKQNQHFVPESYQRLFLDDPKNGNIWVYQPGGQPTSRGVGQTAAETNFYAFTKTDGKKEVTAVEAQLNKLETPAIQQVREVIFTESSITEDFKKLFSQFLVSLHRRTERHRDERQKPLSQENLKELLEDERLEKEAINFLRQRHPNADIVELAMRMTILRPELERIKRERLSRLPEVPDFLFPQLATAERSVGPAVLASMTWIVFKTPDDHPFITTDDPVAMTNGLSYANAMVLFPISKNYFLQAFWGTADKTYFDATPEQVDHLNQQLMKCAGKAVYSGKNSQQTQVLVDQYVKSPHPREVNCEVKSVDGRVFSQTVILTVQESYQLANTHERRRQNVLESFSSYRTAQHRLQQEAVAWKQSLDQMSNEDLEVF